MEKGNLEMVRRGIDKTFETGGHVVEEEESSKEVTSAEIK